MQAGRQADRQTDQDPLLSSPSVEDWAALDHMPATGTLIDSFI